MLSIVFAGRYAYPPERLETRAVTCAKRRFIIGNMNPDVGTIERSSLGDSEANFLPSIVGFYLAFRLFIMLLSVRILGTDPRMGTGLSIAADFLLLLLVAFCSGEEARHPFRQMAQLPTVRWALLFLGFSGCSLFWSGTVSPSTASAYWCAMAADVAIVVLLLRAGSASSVAESLMTGYVWGACLVAIIAWLMPAQSDLRLGDEELLGANQIGYLCGFAFFFAQYLMRQSKLRFGAQALLLAVTLLRTLSKTTIVAFLVAQGFLLIRDKSMSRRSKILAILLTAVVIAASWSLLASYYDVYISAGSQPETLTGRIGIWAYLLAEAVQQPWIGHGFDSVWKVIPPFGPDQFEAAHAHNELLQQFYAYGLAGVCMFVGVYLSLFRHIRRLAAGPLRSFFIALLLFILVRGIADTERFDLSLPLWAIIMIAVLIEQARTAKQEAPESRMVKPSPLTV